MNALDCLLTSIKMFFHFQVTPTVVRRDTPVDSCLDSYSKKFKNL
jgi:hypothetical protein